MLAHVVDAALKHDRDAARAATRGAAPYAQKSKSKVAALDALLIRAEADDDEDAAALRRVFQLITDASAKAAKRGDDQLTQNCGFLTRWLLRRGEGGLSSVKASRAFAAAVGNSDDERWRVLGVCETIGRACHVKAGHGIEDAGGVVAAVALAHIGEALSSIISDAEKPTRLSTAAARAFHELVHALSRGAEWTSTTLREADSDDDTDGETDESCAPDLYQRCRTQLLGLLPAIARSIHGQVGWHAGTSSHRASYVNALRDLLTELGADAAGKVDGTGAASAQARQKSPIQSALASSSELNITIQENDRDGRDTAEVTQAAARAQNAASLRLAWVLRAAPPSLLFVDKDSIATTVASVAQELQAVSHNQVESDDDSDDDGFDPEKEKLKRREARCSRADLKRAACRRACLVLGQVKAKRLDSLLEARPEVHGALQSSCAFLLRGDPDKGEEDAFADGCDAATAFLASSLLKRSLEGALLKGSSASDLAAPLLNILDSGEKPDEPASAAVGALLAPLALQEKSPVLDALLARCGGNGGGLTALERVLDAAQKNGRRDIGGDAADALCREVSTSTDAHRRDRASRLFAKIDADVALPRLRAALKRAQTETSKTALETCVGINITGSDDADGALAFLGQCLKGDASPTEGEIELEAWADRVLKSAPLWVGRIASKGGTRWTNTAAGCAARACVPKDAAALRLWGCVCDEISDRETARAAMNAIVSVESDDLFARLAPLLAMKRAPAKFWFLSGADGAFALLKAALMMNEHKAVKTIAAEVLGRLPPSYTARAAQDIFKYVETPSAETADAARAALYAVCHAATVHGASATLAAKPPVLEPLLTLLHYVPNDSDGKRAAEAQRGAAHALAMLLGAESAHCATQAPPKARPLVVEVSDVEDAAPAPLARLVAACGDPYGTDCVEAAVGAFSLSSGLAEDVIKALQRRDGCGVLRVACANAVATAARQLTDDKALVALGDALAGACIHGGAPREPPAGSTPAQAAVAIVTRAAWLQALFVIVFRTKRVPSSVAAADVFGVALEAARFSGDATVRRGGLVLLSSLVGVDSELWTRLPPASAAQARNALRAVAAADPEKELRELAAQLSSAVDEAIGEAPPVTAPAMPVSASPMIGALNIGL
ncbi:unnamed protein product [Pelagomonas calceolata]|uniref:Uncharacterized protein n=1 Tax=Pelagomonas calceolata TaxID=35677 RepID=A0A7S4E7A5_9STRA|nr:unnamed protein product [Pelagomonas calceolata]